MNQIALVFPDERCLIYGIITFCSKEIKKEGYKPGSVTPPTTDLALKTMQVSDLTNVTCVRSFSGVNPFVNNEAVLAAEHSGTVETLKLEGNRGHYVITSNYHYSCQQDNITEVNHLSYSIQSNKKPTNSFPIIVFLEVR